MENTLKEAEEFFCKYDIGQMLDLIEPPELEFLFEENYREFIMELYRRYCEKEKSLNNLNN